MKSNFDIRIAELTELAIKYYSDKKLKHALRVAKYAAECDVEGIDATDAYLVGLAHDLIEDTDCPQDILQAILRPRLFSAVVTLTKADDDSYEDYIFDVINSGDKLAFIVKKADMKDHMAQVDTLTDKLKNKYIPVLHYFL